MGKRKCSLDSLTNGHKNIVNNHQLAILKEMMDLDDEQYNKKIIEEKGRNIQKACTEIVGTSKELWITNDQEVVDDITCVIVDINY